MKGLRDTDPEIYEVVLSEMERQADGLELIASENFVSPAVLEATGSVLTNKYAEGYPGKRYYGGCEVVDVAERLAIERAMELFDAQHANVQPHSGSQANMAAYLALMEPGEKLLGMDLSAGGHLTHGSKVNFSGRLFEVVSYGVDADSGFIDYDGLQRVAEEARPQVVVAGGSAYSRTIDFARFREVADSVGARLVVDMAHFAGLVAGRAFPTPVPHADIVTSTTHKTLRGPRGGLILCREEHAKAVDRAVFPGLQGGPHNHTTAGIAVALHEAATPAFKRYGAQIVKNAQALAAGLSERGFDLVSGGTDNHLILCDLTNKSVPGKVAARALDRAGIVCNYNTVPFDPRKPFDPSGIRLGTPAVTSRNMDEADMRQVAEWIDQVVSKPDDESLAQKIRGAVTELCRKHPAPGISVSD